MIEYWIEVEELVHRRRSFMVKADDKSSALSLFKDGKAEPWHSFTGPVSQQSIKFVGTNDEHGEYLRSLVGGKV